MNKEYKVQAAAKRRIAFCVFCVFCACHPCSKLTEVLAQSDYWQRRCKEVCSPDEYAMLERAFFRKKENLGLT